MVILSSEYSWMDDYGARQQAPECPLDASTHTCADGGDMLAGFGLSAVTQEASTTSTIQITDNQQPLPLNYPALVVDQCINFDSLFTDASFASPDLNLDSTDIGQDIEFLPTFPGYAPARQIIDAESFYRNAASPPLYQYTGLAIGDEATNLLDVNTALSIQHTLDMSLREELERSILRDVPCVLDLGAGSATESRRDSRITSKGLQLNYEQTLQNAERLNKQDERIRELELSLQQLEQAHSELPEAFIDIPRQWVEVQTNVEQYLKRFTDWAEEHMQASAGDAAQVKDRVKELEAEVRALRQCVDRSS